MNDAISQIFTQTTARFTTICLISRLQYLKFSLKPQHGRNDPGNVHRCNISNFHSNHSNLDSFKGRNGAAISQIFTQTTASTVSNFAACVLQYLKFSLKPQRVSLTRASTICCNISNFHSNHSGKREPEVVHDAAISQIFTQTTAPVGSRW